MSDISAVCLQVWMPVVLLVMQLLTVSVLGLVAWQFREIRRQDLTRVVRLEADILALHDKLDRAVELAPTTYALRDDHIRLAANVNRQLEEIRVLATESNRIITEVLSRTRGKRAGDPHAV